MIIEHWNGTCADGNGDSTDAGVIVGDKDTILVNWASEVSFKTSKSEVPYTNVRVHGSWWYTSSVVLRTME